MIGFSIEGFCDLYRFLDEMLGAHARVVINGQYLAYEERQIVEQTLYDIASKGDENTSVIFVYLYQQPFEFFFMDGFVIEHPDNPHQISQLCQLEDWTHVASIPGELFTEHPAQ